jgi:hypothetical protein
MNGKQRYLAWNRARPKLLDLDQSSAARQHLADALHYQGDKKDSAKMNVSLHNQVMIKLARNGGKVPDELKH